MRITGTRVVLRDRRQDSGDEDLFRWLNLEEWNYYDEPHEPGRLQRMLCSGVGFWKSGDTIPIRPSTVRVWCCGTAVRLRRREDLLYFARENHPAMQTSLPYPDFAQSAAVLDRQRLGKQRVEAYQILRAITVGTGWSRHPIVKMWTGSENALKLYSNAIIEEWIGRGYRNGMEIYDLSGLTVCYPWWLGIEEFHASHRAALLAKDYGHYSKYGWTELPRIQYVWYNSDNGTIALDQGV